MAIDVLALWDHSNPELSEQRFRAAQQGANGQERAILQTQIARTFGMRRDFDAARKLLATLEPGLAGASDEVQARYFLELGRSYASATHTKDLLTAANLQLAKTYFMRAHTIAMKAQLDDVAIDALHMMPFVDSEPAQQLQWNEKAVALMERSKQADAKRWEASLRNNIGYARHLQGDYDEALRQFALSRAAHEGQGRVRQVRIADWMIAWTYRVQKRFGEALEIQQRLEHAWAADGEPDPYVFEELAHLYRALGQDDKALDYDEKQKAASP